MEIDMSKPYEVEVYMDDRGGEPLILANCEGPVAVSDGVVSFTYRGIGSLGTRVATFNAERILYYIIEFYE